MRHGIERHRDEAGPGIGQRHIGDLREDADHRLVQGGEGRGGIGLAEGTAAAEDDPAVDHAEPAHHPLGLAIGPARRHHAAGQVRREFFGRDDRAAERDQRALVVLGRGRQVGVAVGRDDRLLRPHRAAGRLDQHAVRFAPEAERRRPAMDGDALRGHAAGKPAQIVERMDAARAGIEHAADEASRAGLFAHLPGIEHGHRGVAEFGAEPISFLHRVGQRLVVVGCLDLAGAGQAGVRDAMGVDQFGDDIGRLMGDVVHALGHAPAVGGGDGWEGQAELGGDDAAIAPACTPAGLVRLEHDRRKAAGGKMMGGREPGIAGTDDHDIRQRVAGERRQRLQRRRRRPPERWRGVEGLPGCRRGRHARQARSASTASASAFSVGK